MKAASCESVLSRVPDSSPDFIREEVRASKYLGCSAIAKLREDPELTRVYIFLMTRLRRFWPDAFNDEEAADGFFGGRDPFAILREMQERMGRLLDESDWMRADSPADHGRARSPRMDLTEGEDAYLVRLDMPGLDKSDIDVKVEGLLLTITGSSESEAESRDAAGKTLRRERRSGQFQRTVSLPGPVQADKVDARYENGVLTITVPKAGGLPVDPRTIPIR